ncbi:MAG: transglutaminase family protein, partial [Bifidobacterium dentium]
MKKLVFDYEMKLSFSSPVTDHRFQLRCIPTTGPRQQVVDVEVRIEPEVELDTTVDSFDSVVMTGFIPEPHTMFNYSVTGIAFVDNEHIKPEIHKPLYRFNSALTIPGPAVNALIDVCKARIAALPAGGSPIDQAREVMDEVFKSFVYTPASTTIRTTAEEALAQHKGVCQDYA